MIKAETTNRRFLNEAAVIVACWATMTAVIWFDHGSNTRPPYRLWGVATLAVAVVTGAAMALAMSDIVRTRRDGHYRSHGFHMSGLMLGVGVWFLGGLIEAWLSPVLIVGLYMIALCLWTPHVGLGVPSRPEIHP